jgi:hypothetical protein
VMLQQLQQQLQHTTSSSKQQQQQQRQASGASSRHGCISSSLHCAAAGHVPHQHRHTQRPRTAASASTSSTVAMQPHAASSRHSQSWGRTGGISAHHLQVGKFVALQRPSTAPAPQGHGSSSSSWGTARLAAWGSGLGAATPVDSEEISCRGSRGVDDSLVAVRPAAVRAAAAAAASNPAGLRRKPSPELPARHAVQASAAALKMAAVLTQHMRKTGAE